MNVTVKKARKHGIDIYQVWVGNLVAYQFMSREYAQHKANLLKNTLVVRPPKHIAYNI